MNPKIDSHSSPQPLPCPESHPLAQPLAEAQLQPQLETRPESRPEAQTAASQQVNPENYVRKKTKPGRITGLDAARGVMLITSVTSASVLAPRPEWLVHASWMGLTLYDLIFPLFVTLSGVGMAFAYRNRVSRWVSLRRITVLLVVGVIYGAVATGDYTLSTLRLTGTLQLYAGLVALLVLGHLLGRTWPIWAGITLVTATVEAVWLHFYASGCIGGELTPTCNPSRVIDGAILGVHMYAQGSLGHDPEGVIAILGAFVTAAAGTTAGHMALASRGTLAHLGALRLGAWAGVVALYGWGLTLLVPAFKRLWTPSFGLATAALGIILFAVCFWIFDAPAGQAWSIKRPRFAEPLVALGRNSLLVYFGSHLLVDVLDRLGTNGGTEPSLAARLAGAVSLGLPAGWDAWGFVLLNLAFWWILSIILRHFKIYIHA